MKKILLILGVLLVLGGGGAGGWWFFLRASDPDPSDMAAAEAGPVFFAVPGITVSIVRDRRTYGLVVVELALELKDEATRLVAEQQQPVLSDRLYVTLYDLLGRRIMAERNFDLELLKPRLIEAAESVLGQGGVKDLMFQTVENRFAIPSSS
jgi:flagellar basal body-associated protein FliL